MQIKDEAQRIIANLVDRFDNQKDTYKKSDYNETQTRRDFIDPFFEALGWDVSNKNGYAESYREVIHEDKVKVREKGADKTKAPDYSFRLVGGKRLFFVEAKKPSVFIKDEIVPAYQVRRYGWSAKMPISIITDFEEFAIYDCTKKPNPTDKAATARIKYLTYESYLSDFDFIWNTFSKERVLKGSFDKFIQSDTHKKGTATVDNEFLQSLDRWRTFLAESIAKNNKDLNEDEINFAVQQTIDRIIFLRIAEDRSVEPYGNLKGAIASGNLYQNLYQTFVQADAKYNSGLFDFNKDKISRSLEIENKVIKTIVNELYYPECPYEFAVLPVEILGTAYEQFLGKTISIKKAGKAEIEFKPEVRKAGGVYYTPQYIVDYIVENTVGKLVASKTPKEVAKLKIADPACGSGSFLIGAYNFLLKWHLDYYNANPTSAKKDKALTPTGALATALKKQILLNNIYGVDIDVNAVEVTKLSLLLKCMEGETEASIALQMSLFHERVLPTLDNNIKSGNSLIDFDFYASEFDFKEEKKVKPFSWQKAFPEVFKSGGFDCIIGNPPYVKVSDKNQLSYFTNKYKHQDYQQDLYLLFLEQYKNLLQSNGKLGIIIPNTWLQSIKMRNIRKHLMSEYRWERLLHISEHIFKAVVDTHVLIFEKNNKAKASKVVIDIYGNSEIKIHQTIAQNSLPNNGDIINILAKEEEKKLFEKIKNLSNSIQETSVVYNGVKPFERGKGNPPQTEEILKEKPYVFENFGKPKGKNWLPLLRGSLINRYVNLWNENSWIDYGEWLAAPRNTKVFEAKEKIIVRQTSDSIIATLIGANIICRNNLHVIISTKVDHKFLLGVLNSKLTNFFYYQINPEKGEVLAEVKKQHVEQLPIPKNVSEKQQVEIIKLVEQLLELNTEKSEAKLASKIEQLQNRIGYCEGKINELVYGLYGLTSEEIAIVEKSELSF